MRNKSNNSNVKEVTTTPVTNCSVCLLQIRDNPKWETQKKCTTNCYNNNSSNNSNSSNSNNKGSPAAVAFFVDSFV